MAASALFRRAIPAGAEITRWHASDGWALRRFDWPAEAGKARGSILFQGGRGDIFEKYLESFAHWHALGWSITAFDWRGQGGSGRLSPNPHCGHVRDFGIYIDDLRGFYADWARAAAGPRVVFGHSMGGHLILRGLVEGVIDPDAAVLVAPMLGLKTPVGPVIGELAARLMTKIGDPARLAWKANEKPSRTETRESLLTHDHARYEDELWWQTAKPELMLGPPSWQWLVEAFASTRRLRADKRLGAMRVPLLMLIAEADGLVDAKAAIALAGKLPDAELIRFGPESAHEILREADPVRDQALAEIDRFLTSRVPPA